MSSGKPALDFPSCLGLATLLWKGTFQVWPPRGSARRPAGLKFSYSPMRRAKGCTGTHLDFPSFSATLLPLLRWSCYITMSVGGACTVLVAKSAPDTLLGCGKVLQDGSELGQATVRSIVARIDALARTEGCRWCPAGVPSTSRGVRQLAFAMS